VEGPFIRVEESGEVYPLRSEVTTVGRGNAVDVRLGDPSVSRLHAEIVRRGPYTYVVDLGLSRNGTRVNGRPVARRLLEDGDVVSFGAARCRVGGVPQEDFAPEAELRRSAAPELTRRELDVLTSLCRPALSDEAFVAPATAREIAADLVVTEAAVKQHLLRLYQKFRIPEGPNRRTRLANEVVALGLVRPMPPSERAAKSEPGRPGGAGTPGAPSQPATAAPHPPAAAQAGLGTHPAGAPPAGTGSQPGAVPPPAPGVNLKAGLGGAVVPGETAPLPPSARAALPAEADRPGRLRQPGTAVPRAARTAVRTPGQVARRRAS
jgi:FHA domain-containing protein